MAIIIGLDFSELLQIKKFVKFHWSQTWIFPQAMFLSQFRIQTWTLGIGVVNK